MARHRLEALNLLRAAHTAIYYIRVYGRVLNHDASFKIPKASAVQKPVRLEVRGIYPDNPGHPRFAATTRLHNAL
jgi:hypothetical protein